MVSTADHRISQILNRAQLEMNMLIFFCINIIHCLAARFTADANTLCK